MTISKDALHLAPSSSNAVEEDYTIARRTPARSQRRDGRRSLGNSPALVAITAKDSRARQLHAAIVAFRDGDFAIRLPTDWDGIEGSIASAFNQVVAQEARITREISRLSTSVGKEGRLRQRMSVPGALGGWAEKVELVNTLLDDLVRPTTEVARTIGAVAKGDLGQSMELEVDGRPLQGRVPALGEARQHDDRAALGVHLRSDARGARGRHRRQARRPGAGQRGVRASGRN